MKPKKSPPDAERRAQILEQLRRDLEIRQKGYRERALALFPHVCGSCGREFSGKKLRELTVHHKDHDHNNNPPDGSNWELLCIYCHDHEHEKYKLKGYVDGSAPAEGPAVSPIANPFERLDDLLKGKSPDQGSEPKHGS
ncbi:MAG TPA: YajD family HNH nuclease [Verrucomicrobiae bacterium]|nr:YajD family HNH nuclease [Verrucomicrobiae bacterium]